MSRISFGHIMLVFFELGHYMVVLICGTGEGKENPL